MLDILIHLPDPTVPPHPTDSRPSPSLRRRGEEGRAEVVLLMANPSPPPRLPLHRQVQKSTFNPGGWRAREPRGSPSSPSNLTSHLNASPCIPSGHGVGRPVLFRGQRPSVRPRRHHLAFPSLDWVFGVGGFGEPLCGFAPGCRFLPNDGLYIGTLASDSFGPPAGIG